MCSAKRRGKEGIPPSIGHIQTIANERTGLRPPNRHRSSKLGCHLPPRGEIRRRGKVPQRGTGYSRKATRTSPILLHRRPCQSLPGLRRFAGRYGRKRPGRRDVRESGNAIYKSRRKSGHLKYPSPIRFMHGQILASTPRNTTGPNPCSNKH